MFNAMMMGVLKIDSILTLWRTVPQSDVASGTNILTVRLLLGTAYIDR